jgi:hypothetical protein
MEVVRSKAAATIAVAAATIAVAAAEVVEGMAGLAIAAAGLLGLVVVMAAVEIMAAVAIVSKVKPPALWLPLTSPCLHGPWLASLSCK